MDEFTDPHSHLDLVDALIDLATATNRALDELTRAPDVADRAAAREYLRDACYELLAPVSLLVGARGTRAATAVVEAAANVVTRSFAFAPCEVVAPPRRDPREQHRAPRRPRRRPRGVRE